MIGSAIPKRLFAIIIGAMIACACVIALASPANAYAASGELVHFEFDGNYKTSVGNISTIHYGNTKFGAGKLGKAAFFDGDGDYLTAGRGLSLPGDFTFNVWVKPVSGNETRETAGVFSKFENKDGDTGSYGFFLRYNKPGLGIMTEDGKNQQVVSDTQVKNGKWSMLTYTYKASDNRLSIYINGRYDSAFDYGPFMSGSDLVAIGRQALQFYPYSDLQYRGWSRI